ncbi:hypothetical protein [Fulvivirga sedimenti]|uniref:Uncharacterized protein n=1 Tax=Fulvivirga sedimenti TaxID=2879465 RepID=A0A9X1HSG3_9BACT|nr:hypothetical protein [Fulvivirga sedimenti]MCA6075194.1 hypothetical protein [Fulvivirga sedimenti]MCA6076371.1 hypothetical protein [Fulvivirga sedimenti]MCA6077499.1 hypothetical protein [Fulvivirga sedimenti]
MYLIFHHESVTFVTEKTGGGKTQGSLFAFRQAGRRNSMRDPVVPGTFRESGRDLYPSLILYLF